MKGLQQLLNNVAVVESWTLKAVFNRLEALEMMMFLEPIFLPTERSCKDPEQIDNC